MVLQSVNLNKTWTKSTMMVCDQMLLIHKMRVSAGSTKATPVKVTLKCLGRDTFICLQKEHKS